MGNSNSTGGGGGHHHNQQHGHHKHGPRYPGYHHPGYPGPGYDDGWSHSLETPEQRNRMKRGYFPPRAYIGGMPQPQKVLPVAPNPNKLLKATQNGAILHGGGTISGRKLGELELEIRKRSTVSFPGNGMENEGGRLSSGRSTPNLVMMPRMGLSAGLPVSSSSSRSRDYGSEPDLRDVGRSSNSKYDDATLTDDRSSSPPVPNSFTIISESPAKKQIRSRKKSKAPPPPPNTVYPDNQPNPNFLIPYQYQLQQNPQRQLLLTPVNGSPLMGHDENKNKQRIKSRLFKTKAESRSAMNSPALRVTPSPSNELNSRKIEKSSPQQQQRHPVDPDFKNKMRAPNPAGKMDQQIVPKGNNKHNNYAKEEKNGKKTFYFGMDMGTFKQKQQQQQQQQQALIEQDNMGQSQSNHQQVNQTQAHVADLHKEISRRKMLQKLDDESRSSSRNSAVADSKKTGNNNKLAVLTKPGKITANNRASESDSDGIHRRQDSGSFELNEKKNNKAIPAAGPVVNNNKKIMPLKKPRDQSSSDLSSSDLDVPLVVTRPTLPQKRPELPRFSPTAAWRAIDSPSRGSNNSSSNGGRMSFEPDLSGGEDSRLHRFTRPSAPPRISAERSGDSGISAGDAGSPANAIPLLLEEEDDLHNPRVDYNDDFDDEFSSSSPHVKMNKKKGGAMSKLSTTGIVGADRKMKCWTPEQDLDESSSDFDQDNDPILLPPVPPKPGKNQKPSPPSNSNSPSAAATKYFNLFHGKRASAVVSDSDSKYFGGGGNSKFSSSDELNSNPPHHHRRFHGRSPATQQQNGPQKRFLRSPAAHKKGGAHGFVGLDTNWFLSRSEPNSLNFIGIGGEEETRDTNFNNYFRPSKKFSVPSKHPPPPPPPPSNKIKKSKQFSPPQIIPGRNKNKSLQNNQTSSSQDELECQIQLEDEDFDSYSSSDMRKKNLTSGPSKLTTTTTAQSEIGYGPSNMNFNNNKNINNSLSSSAYEDQEEELDLRLDEENDSEELMRDDLFDYLDQYEEGEFEKEQEIGTTFPQNKTTDAIINTTTVMINHHNNNDNGDDNHPNGSRPFSHHIMYLPSYDARKIFNQKNQNWRRTRSVDALDSGEKSQLFKRMPPPGNNNNIKIQNINQERIHHIQVEERNDRKVSAPSYLETKHVSNVTIKGQREIDEEERRAQNKKKFKFQSTLRVQERRKMEEELSREADQREEERLREIEEMKRVEEEFQKKRRDEARARQEQEAQQAYQPPVIVGAKKFGKSNNNNPGNLDSGKNTRVVANNKQEYNSHHYKMMSQRQEPEGAPASVTVSSACNSSASPSPPNLNLNGTGQDLRKELISASKKRSGLPSNGGHQTQELSEYRQETRQYCDYRRAPQNGNHHRQQSPSPARFIQKSSSSSDIFPIPSRRRPGGSQSSKVSGRSSTTTLAATVHPEVVCDIPVKPHPYMVNASRLGGSNSTVHLLTSDDRPNSVLGSAQNLHQFGGQIRGQSSPSGRGGDNYRRDWAHHLLSRGGSNGLGGGRASSVMSLHSAPPMNSDNFRNSTSDLSRLNGGSSVRTVSPSGGGGYVRQSTTTSGPSYRQYSASPPPSASPSETSSRASPVRMTSSTTVISIGPQMNNVIRKKPKSNKKGPPPTQNLQNQAPLSPISTPPFQAQPYTSNNRTRGYRPVSFKPPQPTTTVN
ncbi:hypothetical protein Fcan01_14464 [Folsomia candida]|uniref:Uncharacterized protein n=1 Tax=Folsomia candida TaxID=158441 RepID=A0A226E173_FOLCA|nr:hypothetical protein Fcan01_14464 [Folsomia candida]